MTYMLHPGHTFFFNEDGQRIEVTDWLTQNGIPWSWCEDEWAGWILVEDRQ